MGRGLFDAAAASAAAGAAKDPFAVSIFDAVAKLGLSLEKREDTKDTIVIDGAERSVIQGGAVPFPELKPEEIGSIDR